MHLYVGDCEGTIKAIGCSVRGTLHKRRPWVLWHSTSRLSEVGSSKTCELWFVESVEVGRVLSSDYIGQMSSNGSGEVCDTGIDLKFHFSEPIG